MRMVDPTIEIYKEMASRFEKEFRDYFFEASLKGDDGNDYFITFALSRVVNRDTTKLVISKEPTWFLTTPSSKVIQKGEKPEIFQEKHLPLGSLKVEASSTSFLVSMDSYKFVFSPPSYQLAFEGKDAGFNLSFKSIGTPFWFNQGKEEGARITPSTISHGMELFGEMEGVLTLGGKDIRVKGQGVHEHVISEHIAWMEFGWQDWIWFTFDEMYGLVYEMQGGRYKDGGIYLRKEKEYLVIRDFEIDRPQWAFSPVLQHQWPVRFTTKAHTDKGTLLLEGDVIRSQPWAKINKYKPAMTMPTSDMEVTWKGSFTFKDGRTVLLNEGKGGNEVITIYNFAQSGM